MVFGGMNYLAIIAAAVVAFLFGWVWYAMLGGLWLNALGTSKDEVSAKGMQVRPLVINFVALLVMAWVLAGIIAHLGPGQVTLRNGVISAAFCWVGFVITTLATNHAYQDRKPALTAIDGGHWLGALLIQGVVIGLVGV
jgi:ABC-type uncharacterized transport system permease subunit